MTEDRRLRALFPFPMSSHIPERIIRLAERVKSAGGRALLVGGCVRDALMGAQPKDWDVEVYGVEPKSLRELLEGFGTQWEKPSPFTNLAAIWTSLCPDANVKLGAATERSS